MADTRTIYLHTGIETFSSDPSDLQYMYLDMSDYDNLNPQYQSTIKLSSGVAGIYESTKAKITLTFKGENSGRDARADWVNKYAERINKISVNTTENKSAVFNKSATVSEVEFIDTPYIDGAQVIIEVTMFGRWQSALTVLETVSEKYEGGNKTYLGMYYQGADELPRNYITNSNFYDGFNSWGTNSTWSIDSDSDYRFIQSKTGGPETLLVHDFNLNEGDPVVISFYAKSPVAGTVLHSELWGSKYAIDVSLTTEWKRYVYKGLVGKNKSLYFWLQEGSTNYAKIANFKLEYGTEVSDWSPATEDIEAQIPHYTYNYTYGTTTLQNQIALPKDRNRFMLAIDSQYSVATITLSANGKRATISTSRLSANSSLSSDFVAYDITAFVDTDKFLLLNSGLVASVVWDNLASQYAVLYQIMNSVGDTPADISVTTTGGQHILFKLYTYSIQDFI